MSAWNPISSVKRWFEAAVDWIVRLLVDSICDDLDDDREDD